MPASRSARASCTASLSTTMRLLFTSLLSSSSSRCSRLTGDGAWMVVSEAVCRRSGLDVARSLLVAIEVVAVAEVGGSNSTESSRERLERRGERTFPLRLLTTSARRSSPPCHCANRGCERIWRHADGIVSPPVCAVEAYTDDGPSRPVVPERSIPGRVGEAETPLGGGVEVDDEGADAAVVTASQNAARPGSV